MVVVLKKSGNLSFALRTDCNKVLVLGGTRFLPNRDPNVATDFRIVRGERELTAVPGIR